MTLHSPALAWVQPFSVLPSNMDTRFGSPYGTGVLAAGVAAEANGVTTATPASATPTARTPSVRRSMRSPSRRDRWADRADRPPDRRQQDLDEPDEVTGLSPDRRAERTRTGAAHVVVGDVVDVAHAGVVTAPFARPDLDHDRGLGARHRDVAVVHVADDGAVHGHHAEPGLAGPGDGDVVEVVVREVAARLRAEHERVAALGGQVRG